MKSFFIIFLAIPLFWSCTTYYAHPNKQDFELNGDVAQCESQSMYRDCQTEEATSETKCATDIQRQTNCKTIYYPAKTTCSDRVDKSKLKSCLYKKGWYETDEKGNRK